MTDILSFDVYDLDLEKIPKINKFPIIINTINPHSYVVQKKDKDFTAALKESTVLLPDGIGIVIAAKMLGKKIRKISGYDVFEQINNSLECGSTGLEQSVFFLGSTSLTLRLIEDRYNLEFPNVVVSSHSPPFKDQFTSADVEDMARLINIARPSVLYVGLTAPKQEKLVAMLKNRIDVKVIAAVGAVFDFYAGTIPRCPDLLRKLQLEWLYRLYKEPTRMWKRNFYSTPIFLKDVIQETILRRIKRT